MDNEAKSYPVVDDHGVPLVASNGDAITSTEAPDATTTDGSPAVRATPTNAPHDAVPATEAPAPAPSSESAPPAASDPGYKDPSSPSPASGSASASNGDASAASPASTPNPAANAAAPGTAAPEGQGSGVGAVPPPNPADVPPTPVPGSPTVTATDLAASDPNTPPAAQGPGTTADVPAQATTDPNTPQSVATTKSETQEASSETLNPAMTTTVDATTVAKAQAEQAADATAPITPAAVLGDAVAAATPVNTAPPVTGNSTLVVAPGTADGLAAAAQNGGVTQEGTTDVGAGAADASKHDVVATAPAAGNGTSDGPNASAVSPTGYVAPVRVSAAGVPADDPTLAAVASGDLTVTDLSAHNVGPGTSDRPNPAAPSLGADASAAGTAARTNGSAQASPYVGAGSPPNDRNGNATAQAHADNEAATGSPRPASVGDTTLAPPVPAGDTDAASKAASDAGQDAPAGGATVDGSRASADPNGQQYQSLQPQTPADAAETVVNSGAVPEPVAADLTATTAGPQKVEDLPVATPDAPHYDVMHVYEVRTTYRVSAVSGSEAVSKAKAGEGVKVKHDTEYEDWGAELMDDGED